MAEVVTGTEQQIEELGSGIKATRAIDKRAEEQKKKIALPKIPARTLNDEQWLDYSKPLTSDMWTQIPSMYLYRLKPKIIRQQSNPENKNYIDKLDKVADIRSYIIKNHSWGKYKCEINRYMESGSGEVKFVTVLVDIPEDESPELILDVRELDKNDSSNMGLIGRLKAQGKLDERGNVPTNNGAVPVSQNPTMQDMMVMLDRFASMTEKLNNRERDELKRQLEQQKGSGLEGAISTLFLEKLKQENPATMAQSLTAVLSVAKEIAGPKSEGTPEIIKMMMDSNRQMLEMQQKHSEQLFAVLKETKEKPEPGEKILDSVETAMTIMERLNAISGGGGKRSGWDTGLEYAKELGLPLFNAISQIYTVYKMGKPMDSTIQQQPGAPKPSGKTISGMEAAANAARIAAGQKPAMYTGEPNNTPNPPTEVTPEIVNEEHQQLMALLQPAAGPILKFMADGRSGAELALAIIDMYGAPSHLMLANFGEEKILAAVKGIPQFWSNLEVYGEERVKQFLTEFIHYEDFVEDEEEMEPPKEGKGKKK